MKKSELIITSLVAICIILCIVMLVLLSVGIFNSGVGERGPQGLPGQSGTNGKSAFEMFKEAYKEANNGAEYAGTEEDWLASLKGERGTTWFSGNAEPVDVEGARNGDFYLRTFSDFSGYKGFVIYTMAEGQWVVVMDMSESSSGNYDKAEFNIYTLEELVAFAKAVNEGESFNGKKINLLNSINFDNTDTAQAFALVNARAASNWQPIGTEDNPFEGTFDGHNNTISNLNCGTNVYGGFVGYLAGGTVCNLTLHNVKANGQQVGAVVGKIVDGKIHDVTISGDVELNWTQVNDESQDAGCGVITGVWAGGDVDGISIEKDSDIQLSMDGMPADLEDADGNNYFGQLASDGDTVTKPADDVVSKGNNAKVEVVKNYEVDEQGNWTIYTALGLQFFAKEVNGGNKFTGKTVTLAADIDLGELSENWTPIGSDKAPFKGVFDGQNKTISNLRIEEAEGTNKNTHAYLALFGKADTELKNFTIHNVTVAAPNCNYVAAVVATSQVAKISKVKVTGEISIEGFRWVGGILGNGYAHISNCEVVQSSGTGITSNYQKAGGIAGQLSQGTIEESYVKATITGKLWGTVGGLIGGMGDPGVSNIKNNRLDVTIDASGVDTSNAIYTSYTYAHLTGALIGNPSGGDGKPVYIEGNTGVANISCAATTMYGTGLVGPGGYTDIGTNEIVIVWNGLRFDGDTIGHLKNIEWDKNTAAMGAKTYMKSVDVDSVEALLDFVTVYKMGIVRNGVGRDWRTTVNITGPINLAGYRWEPLIANDLIFDGHDNTISNLTTTQDAKWGGFLGYAGNCEIKNITFEHVKIFGAQAGILVGHFDGPGVFSNVTLKGANVVTYIENSAEDAPGIGVFVGAYASGALNADNLVIDADATVVLNFLNFPAEPNYSPVPSTSYYFGYCYNGTTDPGDSNVTANGKVNVSGKD